MGMAVEMATSVGAGAMGVVEESAGGTGLAVVAESMNTSSSSSSSLLRPPRCMVTLRARPTEPVPSKGVPLGLVSPNMPSPRSMGAFAFGGEE